MNILVVGDIVGRPGRKAIRGLLPEIQNQYHIGFTIVNAENAAGGRGISRDVLDELLSLGIDAITMGNHVWDNKEIYDIIADQPRLVRPANYPNGTPGQGYNIYTTELHKRIAVINVSGRVFMDSLDCPFRTVEAILQEIKGRYDFSVVDLHAEATSEKLAFANYFDGRVGAVLGTHTHVQTADEKILPGGTAYITDMGMTGAVNSILGMNTGMVIDKFIKQRPIRLEVAKGPAQLEGIVLEIDDSDNKVRSLIKISRLLKD